MRGGFARISGRPADERYVGATVSGPWAGPSAFTGLALRIAGPLVFDARGSLGVVMLPVVGDVTGADPLGLKGARASVQVGLTAAL